MLIYIYQLVYPFAFANGQVHVVLFYFLNILPTSYDLLLFQAHNVKSIGRIVVRD